jgi:hypothetical protein
VSQKNFFTSSVKLTSVIALSAMVCHKEYFREYFGCHIAPIKRSWDIVVGVESDCYVSYISVRLILTIWKKEKCLVTARQKGIAYICI